jgi:hypothetical protein
VSESFHVAARAGETGDACFPQVDRDGNRGERRETCETGLGTSLEVFVTAGIYVRVDAGRFVTPSNANLQEVFVGRSSLPQARLRSRRPVV